MVSTRLSPFKRQGQDIKKCKPNENIRKCFEFWRKNPIFGQNIEFSSEIREFMILYYTISYRKFDRIRQKSPKISFLDWMKFDKCHLNLKILLGWRVYLDRTFFLNIYFWINFILKGECRELKKTQKRKKSLAQICGEI